MTGTIKKLVSDKGFGFISSPELPANSDMFFHSSRVTGDTRFDSLHEGDSVTFDTEMSEKNNKLQGVNVQKIDNGSMEA